MLDPVSHCLLSTDRCISGGVDTRLYVLDPVSHCLLSTDRCISGGVDRRL